MNAIVLFTRDLRVHDNLALNDAVLEADHVTPLFVLDDALLGSPNRAAFLLGALADLRESLRRRGGDLVIRRGDPVEEAMRVARATGTTSLFVAADASAYAQRREARLARERLEVRVVESHAAVAPGEVTPADRDHYRVFTPYWRRWGETPLRDVVEAPGRVSLPDGLQPGALPTLREVTTRQPSPRVPRGGEQEGRRRLDRFLAEGVADYERTRDDLAADETSRLSPYLHFGCVSANEVVTRAREAGAVAEPFVRQLCWRDFYLQLLAANPGSAAEDLHERERDWTDDDEAVTRWRDGRTGYPIVDAGMRQLHEEGWIHNRARLIVASFLTKTLNIDWRRGERVFSKLLVDGDVANNVGNWQWVAGTGVDTRPYRSFNPIRQAKRFDPNGDYVRRYVRELASLEGLTVHEPWNVAVSNRPRHYPARMTEERHAVGA